MSEPSAVIELQATNEVRHVVAFRRRPYIPPGVDEAGVWEPVQNIRKLHIDLARGLDPADVQDGTLATNLSGDNTKDTADMVNIIVGTAPNRIFVTLHAAHVHQIPYLKSAFTKGFAKTFSKSIELVEEIPSAWRLFQIWLYHGFPAYNAASRISTHLDEAETGTWIELLRMLDKWTYNPRLRHNVAKWITNKLTFLHADCQWYDKTSTDALIKELVGYYLSIQEHDVRFIVVYFLTLDRSFLRYLSSYIGSLDGVCESRLLSDMDQWRDYLQKLTPRPAVSNGQLIMRTAFATDDAHTDLLTTPSDIEGLLLPFLSSECPLATKIIDVWRAQGIDATSIRQEIRAILGM